MNSLLCEEDPDLLYPGRVQEKGASLPGETLLRLGLSGLFAIQTGTFLLLSHCSPVSWALQGALAQALAQGEREKEKVIGGVTLMG